MQIAYAISWWAILVVIGLVTFPLTARLCGGLPDKGYSVSKILGLLLLTYFSWVLASAHLIEFGYANLGVSLFLLLAVSFLLGGRRLAFSELPPRAMLASEGLFAAAFALFAVFLAYNPDIFFAYSEDFMDFAFVQSILRADFFPPNDPWLAGATLPYYYGGQLVAAILMLLTRVPPGVGYNLAVIAIFALAVSASYGLGYNATGRKLYGALAAVFVCLAGFISGAFQLGAYLSGHEVAGHSAGHGLGFVDWLLSFDLGAGVMPHTGNAYPYYTFTQGFLHAHTVITPFQLLHITLVFGLLTAWAGSNTTRRDALLGVVVLALALGFTAFTNVWTYLASLLVTLLALLLLKVRMSRWWVLAIVVLSFVMYLPYYLTTGTGGISGIGLVSERAHLVHLLEMFALFLFVFVSMLVAMRAGGVLKDRVLVGILALSVAAGAVAFVLGFEFLLVLLPLILVSLYGICRTRDDPVAGLMLVLILVGALILAGCEIFFVDDALSAPNERYNTILKLHLSVWVMWGVAASYAVFRAVRSLRGRSKAVWLSLLGVLIVASLLQPIGLTLGWTSGRHETHGMNRGTLDGLAYLEELAPGDFWAIPWIRAYIEGSPVIVEAPGETYRYSSRISTMTGLPTVIGWRSHEVMWRGSWDPVSGRDTDVDTIYQTVDNERAISLLLKYNVRYVYVGEVERGRYAPEGLRKFAEHPDSYSLAYHNEWAELYEVIAR